jgi:hypothetical protein
VRVGAARLKGKYLNNNLCVFAIVKDGTKSCAGHERKNCEYQPNFQRLIRGADITFLLI